MNLNVNEENVENEVTPKWKTNVSTTSFICLRICCGFFSFAFSMSTFAVAFTILNAFYLVQFAFNTKIICLRAMRSDRVDDDKKCCCRQNYKLELNIWFSRIHRKNLT